MRKVKAYDYLNVTTLFYAWNIKHIGNKLNCCLFLGNLVTLSVAFATTPLQHIVFISFMFSRFLMQDTLRISRGISEPVTMVANELAAIIEGRRNYFENNKFV
jgi:uncharacterized membrane protein YoaK (UPF0700 family)